MRPWTLDPTDSSEKNPLLSTMARSLPATEHTSYVAAWEWYIKGHVISEMGRRYIVNLLGSTMAKTGDQPEDSDND